MQQKYAKLNHLEARLKEAALKNSLILCGILVLSASSVAAQQTPTVNRNSINDPSVRNMLRDRAMAESRNPVGTKVFEVPDILVKDDGRGITSFPATAHFRTDAAGLHVILVETGQQFHFSQRAKLITGQAMRRIYVQPGQPSPSIARSPYARLVQQ